MLSYSDIGGDISFNFESSSYSQDLQSATSVIQNLQITSEIQNLESENASKLGRHEWSVRKFISARDTYKFSQGQVATDYHLNVSLADSSDTIGARIGYERLTVASQYLPEITGELYSVYNITQSGENGFLHN